MHKTKTPGEKARDLGQARRPAAIKSNTEARGQAAIWTPRQMNIAAILSALWLCAIPSDRTQQPSQAAPGIFGIMPAATAPLAATPTSPASDTLEVARISAERDVMTSRTAPVQTLGRGAIERSGAAGLNEVLRTFAGVSVRDYGGIGGLKTVSVRNLGAQHTAVSYDGTVVSDAQTGQVDISRFGLEDLSEVSVETGASDDIFRSARLLGAAGILNLKTIQATDRISARIRYASFNTWNPGLSLSRALGQGWSAGASAEWLSSDGDYPFTLVNGNYSTRERRLGGDVKTLRAEANISGSTGSAGRLHIKARYYRSDRGLPGPVIYYIQDPTERLGNSDASLSADYTANLSGRWRIRENLSGSWNGTRYTNASSYLPEPEDDRYRQREFSSSTIIEYRASGRLRFTLAEDLFTSTLHATIPECPQPSRLSSVSAISGQWKDERTTITASLGATSIREKTESGEAAAPMFRLSPTISISTSLAGGIRLRASYKDGFRAPTLNDLYYSRVGNTSLRPEKARQLNLGLTWASHGTGRDAELTADIYYNSVEDKIIAIPTMFIWKMRNLGRVQMAGADLTAAAGIDISERTSLQMRANWSYRYAVDITDRDSKIYRHQIQYTPRHAGNLLLSLQTAWLDCAYTLNAVGRRYSLPQNIPDNEMPAYFDHSVSAGRSFPIRGATLRISAELMNLGGDNYEIIRYYPMPGRNFRITMKITY